MTFWAPLDVFNFARTGGFDRDQARVATAIAMATSDGADHYQWTHPTTPGVDKRGLYGLDVARVGDDDASSLYHPVTNTEWAYALWKHYGRSWAWHATYNTNNGASVRAMLMALDEDRGWMDRPGRFYGRTRSIARPWSMAMPTRGLSTSPIATPTTTQEELWPTPTR